MKHYKKLLVIGATVMMIGTGCSNDNTHNERENRVQRELNQKPQKKTALDKKVEKSFEEHLKIYPVKSLDDFYDMEGFRDEEFDKGDKGTWVLSSKIAKQKDENAPLISNNIYLFFNKNTNEATGKYVIRKIYKDFNENIENEYRIIYKNNKIELIDDAPKEVGQFLKDFKFLVEEKSFGSLKELAKVSSRHNSNLPMYSINYLLKQDNEINKWIQNKYKVMKQDAILNIENTGQLNDSSLSNFYFEVIYKGRQGEVQYFRESVGFQPSKEDNNGDTNR
ncbi:Csa1 family protein [Macrococcoides canis]|uniref:Csa1 family protein n=1 Tax=Macrococcoides canis TaxID=1855823 RepID=UPI0013E99B91|nr:Csa1 family protein [Macrococcus canis]QIH76447.1 Csa1 family protein [Macrococcus canis]